MLLLGQDGNWYLQRRHQWFGAKRLWLAESYLERQKKKITIVFKTLGSQIFLSLQGSKGCYRNFYMLEQWVSRPFFSKQTPVSFALFTVTSNFLSEGKDKNKIGDMYKVQTAMQWPGKQTCIILLSAPLQAYVCLGVTTQLSLLMSKHPQNWQTIVSIHTKSSPVPAIVGIFMFQRALLFAFRRIHHIKGKVVPAGGFTFWSPSEQY